MKLVQEILTQDKTTNRKSHMTPIKKQIISHMKTLKKNKTKSSLCNCKRNIWNLRRRYRRIAERVGRTSTTYGLLRA